jgi:hypothetical protein
MLAPNSWYMMDGRRNSPSAIFQRKMWAVGFVARMERKQNAGTAVPDYGATRLHPGYTP